MLICNYKSIKKNTLSSESNFQEFSAKQPKMYQKKNIFFTTKTRDSVSLPLKLAVLGKN